MSSNAMKKLSDVKVWLSVAMLVVVLAFAGIAVACSSESSSEGTETESASSEGTDAESDETEGTDAEATTVDTSDATTMVTVHDEDAIVDPDYWADKYPDQYNSWVEAGKAEYSQNDVEARSDLHGKINAVFDMYNFLGNNTMTGCLGCHTSTFTALVAEYGDDLVETVDTDLHTVLREVTRTSMGVGCYSCHGNTPGTPVVTKTWITEAAEQGGIEVSDDRLLVCAQCHSAPDWGQINTNSDPSTWSMLQYGLDPDDYWEVYKDCSDDMYALAVANLPAESVFNQFLNSTMYMSGAVCSDCHMPNATDDEGNEYKQMAFQSIKTNEDLYENCLKCHSGTVEDRKEAVANMEAKYNERYEAASSAVDSLRASIDAAKEAGSVSDDVLADAEMTYKKAQFYLTYGTDVGLGIHTSGHSICSDCLEDAVDIAAEGEALLS